MALSKDLYEMQWANDLSSLASQARYGIKYFKKGTNQEDTPELIQGGVKLCNILGKGTKANQEHAVLPNQIGYIDAVKPLSGTSISFEYIDRVTHILNSMLKNEELIDGDIEIADNFLIEISNVYQRYSSSVLNSLVEEKVFY